MEKLVIKEKVHVKEMKERMSNSGTIELTLLIRNDSYRGFDKRIDLRIPVLAKVERAVIDYDDEDIQAQKAPSLMQQMMEVREGGDSDDEESGDEDTSANTPQQQKPNGGNTSGETKKEK